MVFAANYIGGLIVNRDFKGDENGQKPFVVVPAKDQREALDFLLENCFGVNSFKIPNQLFDYLAPNRWSHWGSSVPSRYDYDVHANILAMQTSILTLRQIEKSGKEDPDAAAETFAGLMAEVFAYRDDRWSDTLRHFGAALGRFLYIMDACMDLDSDSIRNRYNPFRRFYGLPDNGKRFSDILRMLLGECLFYFDILPLVEDVGILKNILCFGLWTQFDKKFDINKDDEHGIGPV